MRINPSVFTNEVFFFIQKKLDLSTITQNKRILAIFLASVTCLAVALYAIKRCYFNAEVVNQKKEPEKQDPELPDQQKVPENQEEKAIRKEYPGMVVEAPMKEEKFNGKGTLLFSDGTKCEVEFENNKLNKGQLTYPSGDKASIYFEDVLLNDNGSLKGKISLNFGKQIEPEKIKFGNFSGMAHIEMWAGLGDYEFLEGEFKEGQFNGKSLGKACMGCGMG
jgi:hypothetical protein